MASEESLAGVGRPDQPSEDADEYSGSHAGAKHARPARPSPFVAISNPSVPPS